MAQILTLNQMGGTERIIPSSLIPSVAHRYLYARAYLSNDVKDLQHLRRPFVMLLDINFVLKISCVISN